MSRECQASTSPVTFDLLHAPKTRSSLHKLLEIFTSCHGPFGGLVTISSDSRGHGIVTSQCSRILSTTRIQQPINRIVASLLTSHLNQYSDHGLFTGKFAINLVLRTLDMDENICLVSDVLKFILMEALAFLRELAHISANTGTQLQCLISLSRSVLSSKPLCGLTDDELAILSKLAVEVYLRTDSNQDFAFVNLEGVAPGFSCVHDGVLVHAADNLDIFDTQHSSVLVACVRSSMAGDIEAFEDATFVSDEDGFDESIIEKLLEVAQSILSRKVLTSYLLYCNRV